MGGWNDYDCHLHVTSTFSSSKNEGVYLKTYVLLRILAKHVHTTIKLRTLVIKDATSFPNTEYYGCVTKLWFR